MSDRFETLLESTVKVESELKKLETDCKRALSEMVDRFAEKVEFEKEKKELNEEKARIFEESSEIIQKFENSKLGGFEKNKVMNELVRQHGTERKQIEEKLSEIEKRRTIVNEELRKARKKHALLLDQGKKLKKELAQNEALVHRLLNAPDRQPEPVKPRPLHVHVPENKNMFYHNRVIEEYFE